MNVTPVHPDAKTPTYATAGSACFDFYSVEFGFVNSTHPAHTFDTGICAEVPDGHVLLIFSRSGHGFLRDIRLANSVGVIDSDYRGSIKVRLTCDGDNCLRVIPGDRIAQGMLLPIQRTVFNVVSELSETERGVGGFGSTGN